jgi:DNA polymerase I-like protein with 3'-5' exonuclease and polymerase domains
MAGGIQNDGNKPKGPVTWVMNDEDFENLLEAIRVCQESVIDLETTGLVEYAWTDGPTNGGVAARVALAALTLPEATHPMGDQWNGVEPTTWVLPLSHPDSPFVGEWRQRLRDVMLAHVETSRPISNVNVKFDARWWFRHTKVDVTHLIAWDPQVSGHVMDELQPRKLKDRAPLVFGIDRWDDVEFTSPGAAERAPLIDLGSYAARDTYWTWALKVHDLHELYLDGRIEDGDEPVFAEEVQNARFGKLCTWVSMPSVAALTGIEQRGIRLDLEWVKERSELEYETYRRNMDWMIEVTGMPPRGESIHATANWFKKMMGVVVDKKLMHVAAMTEGGSPQWNKNVVIRQQRQWDGPDETNFPMHLLEARQADKRLSYLRAWQHLATRDGFIHAKYNVGSVVTGRLSSSDPNMQQVTKKLRPAFIPRDGFVIGALDYSQLELRIAAFISRSAPMIQAYLDGKDLHRMLAAKINGITEDEVTAELRTQAKAGNFGLLYMMGAKGFREYAENTYGVVLTDKEAVAVYRAFFDQWTGMHEWHLETMSKVARDGYITSPIGRVRRLPGIWSNDDRMVAFAQRAGVNSPVQGFGADLMNMGLASAAGLLPGTTKVKGAYAVNTVHDEGTFEIDERYWQEIVPELQERMTNLNPFLKKMGCELDVPLVVDATIGTRWALSDVGEM